MRTYSVGKPSYQSGFKRDLAQNFNNHFIKLGRDCFLRDVIVECEIYAMDICLHFKQESGGYLPMDWLQHLVAESYDATMDLFPEALSQYALEDCINHVKSAIDSGRARNTVDSYYSRFR